MKTGKMRLNLGKLGIVFIVVLTISTLGGCDMFINWFGTSITDRVENFNDDLTADKYSSLYTHFHSDTLERSDMKTTGYDWGPLSYNDARILNYSISGDTVTGTMYTSTEQSFTMEMKKDGLDYYILSIVIGGSYEIRKFD